MIIFRCNAGPMVGFGHLVRCRALAHALTALGEHCVMVGPEHAYRTSGDDGLFEDWIPLPDWTGSAKDAERVSLIAARHGARWAVLDDYRIDEDYQIVLRQAGLKLLQFEGDRPRRDWADVVVDAGPSAHPTDYEGRLQNPLTQLLLGPAYAVLKPEFPPDTQRNPDRAVSRILITFGAGDDRGAIERVLSVLLLETPDGMQFIVMSGRNNPRNDANAAWISAHGRGRVTTQINPTQVASLFASCDLAIMAGGTSTYEAASCGLPMVLISIADNQHSQATAWADRGAAFYLGPLDRLSVEELIHTVRQLVDSPDDRIRMAHVGQSLVDGRGADRVARALLAFGEAAR